VTDFLLKQTGEWAEGKFCHTLASSGGSSNNFGTLGGISPDLDKTEGQSVFSPKFIITQMPKEIGQLIYRIHRNYFIL
jgi:hypothetical protein